MNNEFKKLSQGDITRYVLEDATGGSTSSSSIASDDSAGFKKGLMVTREGNKKIEPPKPRNFVAKNAKTAGAGAHKDKSKTIPRKEKHKKPFMEDHGDAANKGWGAGSYDTYAGSNHGRGVAEEGDVEQELGMAGSELYSIAKHAKELLALIQQHSDEQGLEAWQQSKITKAADYLNAVLQSIDYDTNGDEQGVAEAGMPSSVVKSKQRYAAMSDKEFHAAHKNKSAEELQAMAWRHGYGKGSNHYVDKHKKGQQGVAEGAKVDRQAKHITASMMKKGKSKKDAESIAWAHIKHPKNESVDPYFESLSQMLERQLEPTMDLDAWVDNFQNADPQKYHQFKNKTPEKKK